MKITIRKASRDDAKTLTQMALELARYEKMEDIFDADCSDMCLFLQNTDLSQETATPDSRMLHTWIAESDGHPVGFAMGFFGNFSSFATTWDFCLHDIYVHQDMRGQGIAKRFFQEIANDVCEYTECISFEVLDWNVQAAALYEKLGATHDGVRVTKDNVRWLRMKIEQEPFWTLQQAGESEM